MPLNQRTNEGKVHLLKVALKWIVIRHRLTKWVQSLIIFNRRNVRFGNKIAYSVSIRNDKNNLSQLLVQAILLFKPSFYKKYSLIVELYPDDQLQRWPSRISEIANCERCERVLFKTKQNKQKSDQLCPSLRAETGPTWLNFERIILLEKAEIWPMKDCDHLIPKLDPKEGILSQLRCG